MLSDEEKKAIEIQDSISILENTDLDINNIYSIDLRTYNFAVKTVVNLVKKQQKEIEELNKSDASKEQSSMNYYNLYKELVDKIKVKIEELKRNKDFDEDVYVEEFAVDILQSLLEKE